MLQQLHPVPSGKDIPLKMDVNIDNMTDGSGEAGQTIDSSRVQQLQYIVMQAMTYTLYKIGKY